MEIGTICISRESGSGYKQRNIDRHIESAKPR
jgi:hypothetical protein